MVKYLLLAAMVVGIVLWLSGAAARLARKDGTGRAPPAESMVACAHCGVNLPRGESVEEAGRSYCCDEHRRAGPR